MTNTYNIFKANNRGGANFGWLQTAHSFSFANWYNPSRMGFGKLRVVNDDTISTDHGFGMHGHDNMEIVTIPILGSVTHEDSMGNKGAITNTEVQRMSAGTGVMHSEFNESKNEGLHLFQIWIEPKLRNIKPSYEQKEFDTTKRNNQFQLLISNDGRNESMSINQDAFFSIIDLKDEKTYEKYLDNNGVFVFVIEGQIEVFNETIERRDSIEIEENNDPITLKGSGTVLIIEVPMD